MLRYISLLTIVVPYSLAVFEPWDEYRYIVSLRYQNGPHFCSGTLILYQKYRTVLTSASCLANIADEIKAADLEVVTSFNYPMRVRNLAIHPDFSKSEPGINDIAVLYLYQPVLLLNFLHWVPNLVPLGSVDKNFGLRAFELEPKLYEVDVRDVISAGSEVCNGTTRTLCAIPRIIRSRCGKDFGGPVIDVKTESLVGILPYRKISTCAEPTEYTKVELYLPWIEKVTSNLPWFNFDITFL